MRRYRRTERGAAAVEFALVLPVLLLIVFGIIDFGEVFNARILLTDAARESVRSLAVGNDPATAACAAEQDDWFGTDWGGTPPRCAAAGDSLGGTGTIPTCPATAANGSAATCMTPCSASTVTPPVASVTLVATVDYWIPYVPGLGKSVTMTGRATMSC